MTTVAELIAKLQTLPQEAEVECGYEETSGYSTCMKYGKVDVEYMQTFDYSDTVKYPKMNGKIVVYIDSK